MHRTGARPTSPPVPVSDSALAGVDIVGASCRWTRSEERSAQVGRRDCRARASAHLVFVSIIGIDEIPLPYYRAKLAAERLITAGPVPWTVFRTTQFHQLVAVSSPRSTGRR